MFKLYLWLLYLTSCAGYPRFQLQIPNGDKVPNPFNVTTLWPGVGHQNPSGGGMRNQFGVDFHNSGHTWTKTLCHGDSDNDGKTNGEELGDPDCVWTVGSSPSRTDNISHPGVCEPVTGESCKQKFKVVSGRQNFAETCPTIREEGTRSLDIVFRNLSVAANKTSYMCMFYEFPSDQDYHIIAGEPLIGHVGLVHHMLLFGCDHATDKQLEQPVRCGIRALGDCQNVIFGWTVGSPNFCGNGEIGLHVGKHGLRRIRFESHYNNPQELSDIVDSTGVRFYYRPVRPGVQDIGIFRTGQGLLEIPPGQERVDQVGICPADCTRKIIKKPVKILAASNHMHITGISMQVEVFRNGVKLGNITYEEHFNYYTPVFTILEKPLELLPGDEIKTTCVYNTTSKNKCIRFGDSINDEMCIAFMLYYPKDGFSLGHCISAGTKSTCTVASQAPVDGCDWVSFLNINQGSKLLEGLMAKCSPDGVCRPECCDFLRGVSDDNCMKGEIYKGICFLLQNNILARPIAKRMFSCTEQNSTACYPGIVSGCPAKG